MPYNPFEKLSFPPIVDLTVQSEPNIPKPEPVIEPVKEELKPPTHEEAIKEYYKEKPEYVKILEAHGNQESNIPINSPYWRLRP